MDFRTDELTREANHRLLTGLIVPRPIAWITSVSQSGVVNLAPFSAFTFLCMDPPMIGISVTRRSGRMKDTACNIDKTGEFVVNIARASHMIEVHASATEHAPHVSEAEVLGLHLTSSNKVRVPRLAEAPAALECRLEQTIEFGNERARLIVGRVLNIHVDDNLLDTDRVHTERLQPLGRVGGPRYATNFDIANIRPPYKGTAA